MSPGEGAEVIAFEVRRPTLDVQINQNHGDQSIVLQLIGPGNEVLATASQQRIQISNLAPGTYKYRVSGGVAKDVDFTIKSGQGQ